MRKITWIKRIKNDLTVRLTIIFLCISSIPLFLSSLTTYRNSSNNLIDQYKKSNIQLVTQASHNISNYLNNINNLASNCYTDSTFYNNPDFFSTIASETKHNEALIRSIMTNTPSIKGITYYVENSHALWWFTRLFHSVSQVDHKNAYWHQKALNASHGVYIQPIHKLSDTISKSTGSAEVLTFHRQIMNIRTRKVFGILSIHIDKSILNTLTNGIISDEENVAMINNMGEILFQNNVSGIDFDYIYGSFNKGGKSYSEYNDGKQDYLIVSSTGDFDFTLVKATPFSILIKAAKSSFRLSLVIIVIIMLLIIAISVWISRTFTKPIKDLEADVRSFSEGNYETRTEKHSEDQIGSLADEFNVIAARTDQLIYSEYRSRLAAKDAYLQAIRAQIDPHFIYNALQSIGVISLRHNAEDVYDMISALARMMRYTLSTNQTIVPLDIEMTNINYYCDIQKIRFNERLRLHYDIDQATLERRIPKLILQPLVENAIKHGISNGIQKEDIYISAHISEDNMLELVVRDTGCGISNEKLQELENDFDFLNNKKESDHTGLRNVRYSLHLIYGMTAEMNIKSAEGFGTTITLRIPEVTEYV